MIARRGLLALLGGLPFMSMPMRPDQVYDPPLGALAPSSQSGIFRKISIGTTVILSPSNDTTGKLDASNVQHFLNNNFNVVLAAGTFYGNVTITAHEGQFVTGAGKNATFWKLTQTGIAAFQWTNANPAVYNVNGSGSLIGITIQGPSNTVNPVDGSIGAQMADIPQLACDIECLNLQFPFLSSNQNFFTEQGFFKVVTHKCTNGPVLQVASSGGAGRSGSFARTWVVWYADETLNGSYHNGMQLLAGALLGPGGGIWQYGNFGGTGQSGIAALFVSGVVPVGAVGAGNPSSLKAPDILAALEYNGTGTAPAPVFLDTNCFVQRASGNLRYDAFASSTITNRGNWQFSGPIAGDQTLRVQLWNVINSGFPAGWTGSIFYRSGDEGDTGYIDLQLTIANGTVVTNAEVIVSSYPADFPKPTNTPKLVTADVSGGGLVGNQYAPIRLGGSNMQFDGPGFTAAGSAFWFGGTVFADAV